VQKQTNSKRYIFDGDAIGVSGRITQPFPDNIGIHAVSALPSTGGFGSARAEGFRYREILSFGAAYTEVVGTEPADGVFETLSMAVVEKFNLLDVVTCDRMVSRLTAKHPGGSQSAPRETSIFPAGSRFENLRIGNTFFERLEVAPDFFCHPEHGCWTGLLKGLAADEKRLTPLSLPGVDGKPVPLPRQGQTYGPLGFGIALSAPNDQAPLGAPLVFQVPQFGTVHLGEFFCYPTSRHLVMLRVELGCPIQGQVCACDSIVDGGEYPP
jgi:hypothetical protein